jgi:hypothetical protein
MKLKLLFCCFSLLLFNKIFCQIPEGEVLWLKTDQNVITDENNKVSEWKDASQYANNVTQTNLSNQPSLLKNVFGKRSAVFFDGVNGKYFLSNNSANLTSAGSPRTVFIVGLLDSLATANGGGDFPSAGGTLLTFRRTAPVFAIQTARIHNTNAPDADYIYTAGLGTNSNATAENSNYYDRSKDCEFIDVFVSSGEGTYLRVKQDDKAIKTDQTNTIVSDYGAAGFTVGDREDFSGQDWQGYIAEVIVYNRELTWPEIARTEAYLSYKYHYCFTARQKDSDQGIINSTKPNVTIYPNPVNNILNIDGLPLIGKSYLTITDITGTIKAKTEVNNCTKYVWNISKIQQGNYFISIEHNGSITTKKFMKE